MAKFTSNTPLDMTNDTTFRAWTQELDGAITGCGAAHTADTGQVDLTTVVRPASGSTKAGYKIYSLFGGMLFLKLEFGTYSSAATSYQIWTTIGTSTDGAGGITGTATSSTGSYGTHTTSSLNSYICYDPDIGLVIGYKCGIATETAAFNLVIARTVDAAGDPTADGVYIMQSGRNDSYIPVGTINLVTSVARTPTNGIYPGCFMPFDTNSTDGAAGSDYYVYPHFAPLPALTPTIACVTALQAEVPMNSTITTTVMGTSRTYVCTGSRYASSMRNGADHLCILYED